jgi:uncharacterized damage-inducible protein DinB
MSSLEFRYRGARALVLLHEQELRAFVETWERARLSDLDLPESADSNYASLEALLSHVLWWARDYMVWTCDKLGLPDPRIKEVPSPDRVIAALDEYVEHLLEKWREPLAGIPEEPFYEPQHATRWNIEYPVEALLEHAVVHPMRHRLQLVELLGGSE